MKRVTDRHREWDFSCQTYGADTWLQRIRCFFLRNKPPTPELTSFRKKEFEEWKEGIEKAGIKISHTAGGWMDEASMIRMSNFNKEWFR